MPKVDFREEVANVALAELLARNNIRLARDPPEIETAFPPLSNASIWALIRERAVSGVAGCGDS